MADALDDPQVAAVTTVIFLFALAILLFPDGRLNRWWTWVLWAYLVPVVVVTLGVGRQHRRHQAASGAGRTRELRVGLGQCPKMV